MTLTHELHPKSKVQYHSNSPAPIGTVLSCYMGTSPPPSESTSPCNAQSPQISLSDTRNCKARIPTCIDPLSSETGNPTPPRAPHSLRNPRPTHSTTPFHTRTTKDFANLFPTVTPQIQYYCSTSQFSPPDFAEKPASLGLLTRERSFVPPWRAPPYGGTDE